MTRRRVLLLGGSGFLGTQIHRCLEQDQANDTVATSFTSFSRAGMTRIDVTDAGSLAALLNELLPNVIIWSLMSGNGSDEQALISKGLRTLLEHVSEKTKLIFLSTDSIFGQGTGSFTEDEQGEPPLNERNPLAGYCLAKIIGEALIREKHDNHVILRFGPIYGRNSEGKWDKRVTALIEDFENGREVVRTGNLYKSFIHVEDLACAVSELVTNTYKGTLHVGPLQKASYYAFYRKMVQELGLDPNLLKENRLSHEEAQARGIPLYTSLDTKRASAILQTRFRQV